MDAARIIDTLGGNSVVAQKLGLKRSAVGMWKIDGIPSRHWLAIARLPEAIVAGITPDVLEASRATEQAAA
jgi:hypothetical protein